MLTLAKTTWVIDPVHSSVQFKVKSLGISTVTGSFNSFEGSLETVDEGFANASIRFKADVGSIDTRNAQRDAHLKSDDFFNAGKYPWLHFQSTSFAEVAPTRYVLSGNLTIRDQTRQVVLEVTYGGAESDMYGNARVGFEIRGVINRADYGLRWNAVTDAGSAVVSNEVRLVMDIELIRQPREKV